MTYDRYIFILLPVLTAKSANVISHTRMQTIKTMILTSLLSYWMWQHSSPLTFTSLCLTTSSLSDSFCWLLHTFTQADSFSDLCERSLTAVVTVIQEASRVGRLWFCWIEWSKQIASTCVAHVPILLWCFMFQLFEYTACRYFRVSRKGSCRTVFAFLLQKVLNYVWSQCFDMNWL
jgi:hypothetical protein